MDFFMTWIKDHGWVVSNPEELAAVVADATWVGAHTLRHEIKIYYLPEGIAQPSCSAMLRGPFTTATYLLGADKRWCLAALAQIGIVNLPKRPHPRGGIWEKTEEGVWTRTL